MDKNKLTANTSIVQVKTPFGMTWGEWFEFPTTLMDGYASKPKLSQKFADTKTVLIVTCRFDPHSDAVISALDSLGVNSLRINTEDLLNAYSFTWRSHRSKNLSLFISELQNKQVSVPSKISSGYFRIPTEITPHVDVTNVEAKYFSTSEGSAFLDCLYSLNDIHWVSPPHLIRFADAKLYQLQLALQLGLSVPKTIVTNNPTEAYQFANEHNFNIITKPLITSTIEKDNSVFNIYTRKLSRNDFEEHFESIQFAPTLFQEYIPKTKEIRVTIIGSDIFATEIDSQSVVGAEIDWRQIDSFAIPHKPVILPEKLSFILNEFISHYGIRFGAIDLIQTPNNEYVFLENNPNGQWYWLEVITGQPMAASMARLLTQQTND